MLQIKIHLLIYFRQNVAEGTVKNVCLKSKRTLAQVADKVILKAEIPTFKMIPYSLCPHGVQPIRLFKPLLNFHIKDYVYCPTQYR